MLLFTSCDNSKSASEYKEDCDAVITQILESRKVFFKYNLEEFKLNDSGGFNYPNKFDEDLLMESEMLKELNSITSSYIKNEDVLLYHITPSTSEVLNSLTSKINDIKNESSVLSFILESLFDFLLELLFLILFVLIVSFFSMYTLKVELFSFLFTNWIVGVLLLIICLFVKPAERFGIISSDIDKEIVKSIEYENKILENHLNKIKIENSEKISAD